MRIDREPSNLIASLSRFASSLPYRTPSTLNTDLYMQTTKHWSIPALCCSALYFTRRWWNYLGHSWLQSLLGLCHVSLPRLYHRHVSLMIVRYTRCMASPSMPTQRWVSCSYLSANFPADTDIIFTQPHHPPFSGFGCLYVMAEDYPKMPPGATRSSGITHPL